MKKTVTALVWVIASGSGHSHDLTALPLGDGKLSQSPKVGWIWACHTDPQAGGAQRAGPWINTAKGTYDATAKPVVPGQVSWPSQFRLSVQQDQRVFSSNDLPSHPTGSFPIPSSSDAYRYDRNPNSIAAQTMQVALPLWPELAAQPTCVPGAIGFLLSGAVLFNALDAPGRDAVAHETQDACQGHPQESGVYHYHNLSNCVADKREPAGHSALVGYLLDGFGIYGPYGEKGQALASKDLDECHGHTHTISWEGKQVTMYHYHATPDFPYTAGCLRGSYKQSDVTTISGPRPQRGMGGPGGRNQPPGMQQQGGGTPQGGGPGGPGGAPPDLNRVAAALGIGVQKLRDAMGPPPPDLQAAATKLGISVDALQSALNAAR
ncbi:YHYH protein [Rhodoferax saidenbachensis]|uniref:YHYH domain-containing protein n=1 Tax=Rhodoferax saidenbachensis TaxID=1484693 RepID=A0A1P8KAQ9_9BURK|nr:YHYH protein [Rhodoferax saidenbachensis]APW43088.1 hypothetical protein RS694_11485 [Rhodoferax saidenbachensis]